jgi:hypothetical protein
MEKSSSPVVRLAPPGAGIPALERFVSNLLLRTASALSSPGSRAALVAQQQAAVLERVRAAGPRAGQPVLIPRLRGLEDSSRFWSVYMTVDHLRIVNSRIAECLRRMIHGLPTGSPIGTAEVKPSVSADDTVVPAFESACEELAAVTADPLMERTFTTYPHPWFGPLRPAQWHYMAGFHMRLHVRQIDEILARLDP